MSQSDEPLAPSESAPSEMELAPSEPEVESAPPDDARDEGERYAAALTPVAVVNRTGHPLATYAILALMVVGFIGELLFPVAPRGEPLAPDVMTLVASGGMIRNLVEEGEWYRLFTAAFLHADIVHLLMNGIALLLGGVVLERLFGRRWLVALFVIGALGGSGLSYALNAPDIVSVGASGAIMALLAAAVVSSFRLGDGEERTEVQAVLLRILIPSLVPLAMRHDGGHVDYAAHLGGAIVGTVAGIALLRSWPRAEALPRFRWLAAAIALAGAIALVIGVREVLGSHAEYAEAVAVAANRDLLIPDEQLPDSDEAAVAQSQALLAKYPRDPRSHLAEAMRLVGANDAAGAEAALRRALAERDILRLNFPDRELEIGLRAFLAHLLVAEEKRAEAAEVAAPVCKAGEAGAVPERLRDLAVCP